LLRVLRALEIEIPDKAAEDWLVGTLDPNQRGYVLPEELEVALSKQSFYQVIWQSYWQSPIN
jgi:hypothetical protein